MWSLLTKGLECLHNKHSQVCLPHDIKMRLKTKQVLKLLKKIQLEFKCENEVKKQDVDLWYDTQLLIIFWGKLCTKGLRKQEKQVKKWWQNKQRWGCEHTMRSVNIIEYAIKNRVGTNFSRKFRTNFYSIFSYQFLVSEMTVFHRNSNLAKIFSKKTFIWGQKRTFKL